MALDLVQRYNAPDLAVQVDSGARSILPGTNISFTVDPATGAITINAPGALGGTVTSVGASGSTGLTIGGVNPVTTSGVITFTLSANLQGWSGISPTTGVGGPYVLKAGDTMTGQLVMTTVAGPAIFINTPNQHIRMRSSLTANAAANFDIGQNPSGAAGDNNAYIVNRVGGIDFYTANTIRGQMTAAGGLSWNSTITAANEISSTGSAAGLRFNDRGGSGQYIWYSTSGIARLFGTTAGGDVVVIASNGDIAAAASSATPAKIGVWTGSSAYGMFGWSGMTGNEYGMLVGSADASTYISSRTGGTVKIRPSANSTAHETTFDTTGMTLSLGGSGRKLSRITLGTAAPGALADGELYLRY